MKPHIIKELLVSLMALSSTTLYANDLFKNADINAGKKLVNTHCISCHASSFGGDGSEIYTRELRKIKTPSGLVAQVRNCNTMLDLKWFDEDEVNVAAYLNQQYYHFK
jgi:mono/diheme cytochrome c family protein